MRIIYSTICLVAVLLFCCPLYADREPKKEVEFEEVVDSESGKNILPMSLNTRPVGVLKNSNLYIDLNYSAEYATIVIQKDNMNLIMDNVDMESENSVLYNIQNFGSGSYRVRITFSDNRTYIGNFVI